ncbi:amylo-alpha-1,6-glucosidase [Melittangium boletus]|uniref:Amylo-alpha-1,6-glucosidase n=1 Tax=Melittangium boletus DSM 14713 TaxID=1294270 RepID=A0A250I830_9BACT|nr:amylo-alpha-1,6-glucosidase [Melittangium boletus]ATB27331.1 amylo-alpha-1,6-glucosidase [Melittangium boletus DSM 14713]
MKEIIRVEDQYYILATAAHDELSRVLKCDDTFALFDRSGNIRALGRQEQGVYHEGTRFLSRLELRVNGQRPLLLSSSVVQGNTLLAVDLTNPDIRVGGKVVIPHGSIHIFRARFLGSGTCHERLRVQNFGQEPASLELSLEFDADFRDIFEVRGTRRDHPRPEPSARVDGDAVVIAYQGLDKVQRTTRVSCQPKAVKLDAQSFHFQVRLEPHQEQSFYVTVACAADKPAATLPSYDEALLGEVHARDELVERQCRLFTSNTLFSEWLDRSVADLRMMTTRTEHGFYPYAGVPWYSTPFGRDAVITAFQALWLQPSLAAGVLRFLAATQARALEPERDAEPGKILHEMRRGEMAALGEIPFGRYYGTVDATPLFLMLASAYYQASADKALIESLWPSLELAVRWMREWGDLDQDGFLEYSVRAKRGLSNQCWKDSWDSVFHANGTLAEGPLALCEVQGYAYAALKSMAELAESLGRPEQGRGWRSDAERLRQRFEDVFWCDDLNLYALALDGRKRPCRVRASNAGHCLYTGIASEDRARRIARTLTQPEFFSGWGIRTVAEGESLYNPMSYHNGSIWPHDNALIAAGFARYGLMEHATQVFQALFEASLTFDLRRIPELYCGFVRRAGEGPTLYPVACSPQAWAAGSVLMLLGACLGLELDAPHRRLKLNRPILPPFLDEVRIDRMQVGDAMVDLVFHRYDTGAGVDVLRRHGDLEVIIVK